MLFLFLCFLFAFYALYYFILIVLLMLFLLYSSWSFVQTQDALTKCISCVCRTGSSEKECLTVWRVWPAFKKTIPIMCLFKPETSALTSQTSESSAGSGRASGNWCGHWINLLQFDQLVHWFMDQLDPFWSSFIAPGGSKADARRRNVKEKKSNLEEVTAFFEFSFCLL